MEWFGYCSSFGISSFHIFFMKFSTCASDPHQPLVALGNCVGKVLVWEVEGGGMEPKEVMRMTVGTKGGGVPAAKFKQNAGKKTAFFLTDKDWQPLTDRVCVCFNSKLERIFSSF